MRRILFLPLMSCLVFAAVTEVPDAAASPSSPDSCALSLEGPPPLGISRSSWIDLGNLMYRVRNNRLAVPRHREAILSAFSLHKAARRHLLKVHPETLELTPEPVPQEILSGGVMRAEYALIQETVRALKNPQLNAYDRMNYTAQLEQLQYDLMLSVDPQTGAVTLNPLTFDIAQSGLPRAKTRLVLTILESLRFRKHDASLLKFIEAELREVERDFPVVIDRQKGEIHNAPPK